ncbi:MAG: sensor histidine kinase [Firmicutes bacterium]|nr:sensor histidine kinase [Bacillota bacterium]
MVKSIHKLFNGISMRNKLIMLTLVISIIPIIILGTVSYKFSMELLKESVTNATVVKFEKTNAEIDARLKEIEEHSVYILSNDNVQKLLQISNYQERLKYENEAKSVINQALSAVSSIHSIQLYDRDGNLLFYKSFKYYENAFKSQIMNTNIKDERVYERAKTLKGERFWTKLFPGSDKLSMVRAVNAMGSQDQIGILIININEDEIERLFRTLENMSTSFLMLYEWDENIIYSSGNTNELLIPEIIKLAKTEKNSFWSYGKYAYINYYSSLNDWNMLAMIPGEKLFAPINIIRNITVLIVAACFILSIAFSIIIAYYMMQPVTTLRMFMEQVESGNLNIRYHSSNHNEISQLGYVFNAMLDKLNKLIRENTDKQRRIRVEELKALQAQIKPHFLYNTLDNVYWMAQLIDAKEICNILSALANYYRISLSKGTETIKIKEEIRHVENYMTIQKIRYANKIDFGIQIPDEILDMYIVKLTLQPIVENAIYHGLRDLDRNGDIRISGKVIDGIISIEVRDNGRGMSKEKIDRVINGFNDNSTEGYGLSNVNERIQLYFGDNYGISINSVEHEFTSITVRLPQVFYLEKTDMDTQL